MSRIPCKKCKSCGVYHDLSILTCDECGADLKDIPALMVETDDIPGNKYGEIDESITVFVQKCSACGALSFTADKQSPVKVCHNCHKTRIAAIEPEEYTEAAEKVSVEDEPVEDKNTTSANAHVGGNTGTAKTIFDDDDDDDEGVSYWSGVLGNISESIGGAELQPARKAEVLPIAENPVVTSDNDDEDVPDWSGILGGEPAQKKVVVECPKPAITLTAVRHGRLSFTIEAKDNEEYMLGRAANQSELLSNDGRVSNEHCCLSFKNGAWYVKDNHSSNGTAVNSRDLGLNGESRLNDGDELKLGHHSDSMAFRITIR